MGNIIRIALIDDSDQARLGLKALLDSYRGVEIIGEASNGADAVLLVEDTEPDVVILDMQMPGMNGADTTRLLKDRWPHIKVIALTLYSSFYFDALEAGIDHYLMKGCSSEALMDAICK